MNRRKNCIARVLLCMLVFCFFAVSFSNSVKAGTLYESSYVSWTPDPSKFAWTVKESVGKAPLYYELEGKKPSYWYPEGTKVEFDVESTLRALKKGEHYYAVEIYGEIPIRYWEVEHSEGKCIHDCTVKYWHGVENKGPKNKNGIYSGEHCNRTYYSGWTAYCADCGGGLNTSIVYMSKEAAESITSVDTRKGYYYSCPSCEHIENTMNVTPHECKSISYNQYRVVYDKNVENPLEVANVMADSYHMYNNATEYEGQPVTPNARLSKNVYTRTGYVFTGWKDEDGNFYKDGAVIKNLSGFDWNVNPTKGTVTLYAQWEKAESTLRIDLNGGTYSDPNLAANGGKYDKTGGLVTIKKKYGESYRAKVSFVMAPLGYTVSFDSMGGEDVSPITQSQSFSGWTQVSTPTVPFKGRMVDDTYYFIGANGVVDTIKANYRNLSITLPNATRTGYSFGGWYSDSECTIPVGFAGDKYTASENTTLYAKWVELVLTSEPNYIDNDGKGAADLTWSQPDGKAKYYKAYKAKEDGAFELISGTGDDMAKVTVHQDFTYKASYDTTGYETETYVVPYTGFYELSAGGAQGGGYDSKKGGKGGKVTAKFFLTEGEKIVVSVGGKGGMATAESAAAGGKSANGYRGGRGKTYGSGGGATIMKSNRQGLLLVAGGGGGASPAGNGGKGGTTEALHPDGESVGQGGQAGGGGGYVGGSRGEYEIHSHDNDCYVVEDKSTTFDDYRNKTVFSSGDMRNHDLDEAHELCSATNGDSNREGTVTAHGHTNGDNANFIINIGKDDENAENGNSEKIPTKGNVKLTIPFYVYVWGQGNGLKEDARLRIYQYNENGTRIASKTFNLCEYYTATNTSSGVGHKWIGKSDGTPHNFEVDLKENTTHVSINIWLTVEHKVAGPNDDQWGAWVDARLDSLNFTGGTTKKITCGKKEGQVISSKPAYGGSNFISDAAVNVVANTVGTQKDNGVASLKSLQLGFSEEQNLNGVAAPDEAGPMKIPADKLRLEAKGRNGVVVTFQKPEDEGTGYRFQVESYDATCQSVLSTSNITQEILTTGVAGYYYILDTIPESVVTADNADNKGSMLQTVDTADLEAVETMEVSLTEDRMYLHLAAVDKAGNVGETTHIPLNREQIPGLVSTGQVAVKSEVGSRDYGSVYRKEDTTYYVRADGETPFLLSFPSYIGGVAGPYYQIDHQIFDVTTDTLHQRCGTQLPISNPVSAEDEILEAVDFIREMRGDSILLDAMNTFAVRKQNATENDFSQAFTLSFVYHGSILTVTPLAGVTDNREEALEKGKVVFSGWEDDITHGVTLIGDGEGPVISGMEVLENGELLNENGGTFILHLSAVDELSGIREFSVEVTNRDNSISQTYVSEEGVIVLEITEENPVFCGDFIVSAYGVDNVGNETLVSGGLTEFALTATVERILVPHEPLFKRGESGILSITVWGYADAVEVEFPEAFVRQNPALNQTLYYTDSPQYNREESLQFMVPLEGVTEGEYEITVRAYKNGRMLEAYPELYVIGTESVAAELRTRLR